MIITKKIVCTAGTLALITAFDTSAYTYDWNVNGTPSIDPLTNYGATLGLGPGGKGMFYAHRIQGLAPGDEWHITGADHAVWDRTKSWLVGPGTDGPYDPNWATTGGGSGSYGVGPRSWCEGGTCASDPIPSWGSTDTGQAVLFELSSPQTVTITLSGNPALAPAVLGQGKYGLIAPHSGTGGLNTGLNPAFTLFSGLSTTGTWPENHTIEVDGTGEVIDPEFGDYSLITNLTYLYHDDNSVHSGPDEFGIFRVTSREADKTLEHTFNNLPIGFYTLWLGGNIDNPQTPSLGAKNFYVQIQTAAPVPIPAAGWLWGSAMAVLGLFRRSRVAKPLIS